MKRSPNSARHSVAASRRPVRLEIELTHDQFSELKTWSEEVRSTPEELATAFAMDSLKLALQGSGSFEDSVATTIYALREFVDQKQSPRKEEQS